MNWYYVEQGKQAGPVNDEQFDEMVRSGRITADTLVWREGMADWKPCREAKGGAVSGGVTALGAPGVVCAECGKIFPPDETIRYGDVRVCASCKPLFLQKLQEGASLNTGEMRYAGFWIRVAARIIDGLIIGVPLGIVFVIVMVSLVRPVAGQTPPDTILPALMPSLIQVVFLGIQMVYEIFFLGKYGATPGKMACSIKVVTADGGSIGYGRATGRFFAYLLSGIICYIGYIIAAFDQQKRALHDYICNTRVVYK
ncbi:MAG TPA: RDD family protein [Pseudomonadales bacterium]|nr:RDD family protein [Pseudomonadales bacterium]